MFISETPSYLKQKRMTYFSFLPNNVISPGLLELITFYLDVRDLSTGLAAYCDTQL